MIVATTFHLMTPPLLLVLLLVFFGRWWLRREKKTRIPKLFRPFEPLSDEDMPKHTTEIYRDQYRRYKVPKNVDVIVIGSGISGLTCAGLLARTGRRVLVLEQHYIAGGATHTFDEQGFEFDTGKLHIFPLLICSSELILLNSKFNVDILPILFCFLVHFSCFSIFLFPFIF